METGFKSMVLRFKITHEILLLFMIAVLMVIMSLLSDKFFNAYNLLELTRNLIEIGLLALPMTYIIITAGIDLSVGSIVGMCVIFFGLTYQVTGSIPLAALACILAGSLGGFFNGWLIGKVRIPALIVTLATMYVYRGIALGISEAKSYANYPEWFYFYGQGDIGPIPTQLVIFVVCAVIFSIGLTRTYWGRFLYTIGFNEEGANYAGIKVARIKYLIYTLSGFVSSLAAMIFVSRITTAKASAGDGFALDVIAAVVLGGTSISGGIGSILGTVLGLAIIGILRNGLTLARFPSEIQSVIIGSILILSVISGVFSKKGGK
jgi:rhamnose transport system permease protein